MQFVDQRVMTEILALRDATVVHLQEPSLDQGLETLLEHRTQVSVDRVEFEENDTPFDEQFV